MQFSFGERLPHDVVQPLALGQDHCRRNPEPRSLGGLALCQRAQQEIDDERDLGR